VQWPSMRRPVVVKWVVFISSLNKVCFFPPSGRCRHASIRTLAERIVSLGACWAFSVQSVLPSVWRPVVLLFFEWNQDQAINPVTGIRLLSFLFVERFRLCLRRPD